MYDEVNDMEHGRWISNRYVCYLIRKRGGSCLCLNARYAHDCRGITRDPQTDESGRVSFSYV